MENRPVFRRSIVTRRKIRKGSLLTMEDIDFKRPGSGISSWLVDDIVGKTTTIDLDADQILEPEHLDLDAGVLNKTRES